MLRISEKTHQELKYIAKCFDKSMAKTIADIVLPLFEIASMFKFKGKGSITVKTTTSALNPQVTFYFSGSRRVIVGQTSWEDTKEIIEELKE